MSVEVHKLCFLLSCSTSSTVVSDSTNSNITSGSAACASAAAIVTVAASASATTAARAAGIVSVSARLQQLAAGFNCTQNSLSAPVLEFSGLPRATTYQRMQP